MLTIRSYNDGKGLCYTPHTHLAEVWFKRTDGLLWVDFEAPTSQEMELLTSVCGFHPLSVEDVISPEHQPKIDEFDFYLFMVFRSVSLPDREGDSCFSLETHERDFCEKTKLAAYLGKDFLVTIHHRPIPAVDEIRRQIDSRDMALEKHLDQVLHAIVDRMVDGVFPVLEAFEERIELIEDSIFHNSTTIHLSYVLKLKRGLLNLRRIMGPQREMLARMSRRDDLPFIQPKTVIYFRDVYDHAARIEESILMLTDLATGVAEAQLSVTSNRMNEVMKFLTIFSTIWMPLTFIAGIYGMNFEFMPELHLRWFYPIVWVVMIVIVLAMLWFFRQKKWI
ncbi:MAG: magnesium/cobalt transporter CorA [Blastocatellia bacterium]|nr:magnesium/cobalt transporter CorA [Blastocatellia bacterium]